MIEDEANVPDEISCADQIFDVAMHKSSNTLAAGLIDGSIEVWRHTGNEGGENAKLLTLKPHMASVRGVVIADDGQMLYTVSKDRSIKGIDTNGAISVNYVNAHRTSINKLTFVSQSGLATGDDSGHVKIW